MDKLDDNKFAHLLQPIRDLAANWDINIANELEDYLVSLFDALLICTQHERIAAVDSVMCFNACV